MNCSLILLLDHWGQRRAAQRPVGDAILAIGKGLTDNSVDAIEAVHLDLQESSCLDDSGGPGDRRAFLQA